MMMIIIIYVSQCYCTAAETRPEFELHNAQRADSMEEYVKIIYQETQGYNYITCTV